MKKRIKDFLKSPIFKKLLAATAVTAAATAATTAAVKVVKKRKGLLSSTTATTLPKAKNIYITGGSVAALAAAAYLIKDGGYDGSSIHVYGAPVNGAISEEYGSIGDVFQKLMKDIEAVNEDNLSISDMIDNAAFTSEPTVKLIDGSGNVRAVDISPDRNTLKVINKALKKLSGNGLEGVSIREYFADMSEIFESDLFDFIEMSFGLRDEHKVSEFIKRAEQVLVTSPQPGFYDTLYYDFSAVKALENYLVANGVDYRPKAEVTGIETNDNHVGAIHLDDDGTRMTIYLNSEDKVIFNAGRISDNMSEGSHSESAPLIEEIPPSLPIWSQAAMNEDKFGIPELILADCPDSMELSIVDENNYLIKKICEIIGSDAEQGISLLLTGSNWRMKLTGEGISSLEADAAEVDSAIESAISGADGADSADITDEDISAAAELVSKPLTGCINVKGMYCSSYGNFVEKPMRECTGTELLYELCCHLGIMDEWEEIIKNITVTMITNYPYKTAPLATLQKHTLPDLQPCDNCYVIGQFMENAAPSCTLEQEVLSARNAVYALMGVTVKRPFGFGR